MCPPIQCDSLRLICTKSFFGCVWIRLEYVFGLGQGRYIDRCVASHLQMPYRVCKSPVGHRKLGYLTGVPERFLFKYKNYYHSLMVRMSHSLDNRGSHSFVQLKQLGERLAKQSIVVFAMGLSCLMQGRVSPVALRAQDVCDVPWARWRALQECESALVADADALGQLRRQLRVLLLLAPYLDVVSLRCFWCAHCFSSGGHRFYSKQGQHLPTQLFGMLWSGQYQGCNLIVAVVQPVDGTVVVHPACQCATRPQAVPGSAFSIRGGGFIMDPSIVTLRGAPVGRPPRTVRVPWWVSRSLHSGQHFVECARTHCAFTEHPRWQTVSRQRCTCHRRCQVSVAVIEAFKEIDAALAELQRFGRNLAREMHDYCLGDVGVTPEMQEILGRMSMAWWLPDVLQLPAPTAAHVEALKSLYQHLEPDLKHMAWPPEDYQMSPCVRRWPTPAGLEALYRVWWRQVHRAGNAVESRYRMLWRRVTGYKVRAVVASALLLKLGMRFWPENRFRVARSKIASLIGEFLVGVVGPQFFVPCGDVGPNAVNVSRGDILVLRSKHHKKRLVIVCSVIREINQQAVAAALEQDSAFAEHCWHINTVFARCRRIMNTEAPCERWVGALKYLYNPIHGSTTTTLTKRLRARLAGLRSDGGDEGFIQHLAESLHAASSHRDTHGRVLSTLRAQATARASKGAYSAICALASAAAPAAVFGSGRRGRAAAFSRRPCEPIVLASQDALLLTRAQNAHGQGVTLPLFASTRRQWENDMARTTRERTTTARAQAWAASRATERKALHAPPGDEADLGDSASESSASTSSSSSSGSAASRLLSSSPASPHQTGSMPAAPAGVALMDKPVHWVAPKNGILHLRVNVDIDASVLAICMPHRSIGRGYLHGDTMESATSTQRAWCKQCKELLDIPG